MRHLRLLLLCVVPAIALGACRFASLDQALASLEGASTSQSPTIATVEGRKITQADLDAEIAAQSPNAPAKLDQQGRDMVLRGLIARTLLAEAARSQGLDKTAAYQETRRRLEDSLLATALQAKFAASAKTPSDADVAAFMASHSASFAQRRILGLDQLRFERPSNPALVQAMSRQTSLDGLSAVLTANHVPFQRGHIQVDGAAVNPDLVEAMTKLPAGALFVLPNGGGLVSVNAVTGSTVQPFVGPAAQAYARQLLNVDAKQAAVKQGLDAIFLKAAHRVKTSKPYSVADILPQSGLASAPVVSSSASGSAPH